MASCEQPITVRIGAESPLPNASHGTRAIVSEATVRLRPNRKPTVAYLIGVHQEPKQLGRLVRALCADWARFFIHVDARVDSAPFEHELRDARGVIFLKGCERVRVRWGGFSQVDATLRLIGVAVRRGPFERYVLLTGSDYPIKPTRYIGELLESTIEFARIDRPLEGALNSFPSRNVTRYHFNDWPFLADISRRCYFVERLISAIPKPAHAVMRLYHGSAYWALTDSCIRAVLSAWTESPRIQKFLRFSMSPDEILFATLVKNSSFEARISHDFTIASGLTSPGNQHGAHYIDWSDAAASSPKVLGMEDLPYLMASKALFARKFCPIKSAALLDLLDDLRAS